MSTQKVPPLGRTSKVYQSLYTCRMMFALCDMNILCKKDLLLLDGLKEKIFKGLYLNLKT